MTWVSYGVSTTLAASFVSRMASFPQASAQQRPSALRVLLRVSLGELIAGPIVSHMANDAFNAVAHPIRRAIVERLAHGPATVGVVSRGFCVSKPTISKHVKVLENAGVVVRRVEGRTHRLDLNVEPLAEAASWFDSQRAIWTRMFGAVDDLLNERRQR